MVKNFRFIVLWSLIFTHSSAFASDSENVVDWYRKEFSLSTDTNSDISEINHLNATYQIPRTIDCIAKLDGYAGYTVVYEPNYKIYFGFTDATPPSISKCTSHRFFEAEYVPYTSEELNEILYLLVDNINKYGLKIETSLREGKVLVYAPQERMSELEQNIVNLNISDIVLILEQEHPLGYMSNGTGEYEIVSIVNPG